MFNPDVPLFVSPSAGIADVFDVLVLSVIRYAPDAAPYFIGTMASSKSGGQNKINKNHHYTDINIEQRQQAEISSFYNKSGYHKGG